LAPRGRTGLVPRSVAGPPTYLGGACERVAGCGTCDEWAEGRNLSIDSCRGHQRLQSGLVGSNSGVLVKRNQEWSKVVRRENVSLNSDFLCQETQGIF
jgi:hypothetical protein